MRTLFIVLTAAVLGWGSVVAQDPPVQQRRILQQQVVERLLQNVQAQTGMTEEQFDRYREIARRSIEARNEIRRRERELWRELEGEMRPGVAADEDQVLELIDALVAVGREKVELVESEQQEYAEFLTPVQRAQLLIVHRRFERNIQQIIQRRLENRPG